MKNKIFTFLAVVGGITVAALLVPQRLLAVIGSPTEIFNLVSHWIPVRDVDNQNLITVSPVISKVHATFALAKMFTVPAGKTLIIEAVSGHCDATQGIGYAYLSIKKGSNYQNAYFPGSVSHGNAARWSFHAFTRVYAAEGSDVWLGFDGANNNAAQDLSCEPSLSGRLVDTSWNNDPSVPRG